MYAGKLPAWWCICLLVYFDHPENNDMNLLNQLWRMVRKILLPKKSCCK